MVLCLVVRTAVAMAVRSVSKTAATKADEMVELMAAE